MQNTMVVGGGKKWPWGKKMAVGKKNEKTKKEKGKKGGKREGKRGEKGGKRGKIDEKWGKNKFSHIFSPKTFKFPYFFPKVKFLWGKNMEICLKKALKWHLFRLLTQKIFTGGASAPPPAPPLRFRRRGKKMKFESGGGGSDRNAYIYP